ASLRLPAPAETAAPVSRAAVAAEDVVPVGAALGDPAAASVERAAAAAVAVSVEAAGISGGGALTAAVPGEAVVAAEGALFAVPDDADAAGADAGHGSVGADSVGGGGAEVAARVVSAAGFDGSVRGVDAAEADAALGLFDLGDFGLEPGESGDMGGGMTA
ncbi:hypothetical protein ACFWWS_39760, partial [Streptomyces sp. NPDC059083]